MEFEVQAKTNNGADLDIFVPVESLDQAFEVAEQHKTVENCYVLIVRKKPNSNCEF
jgi:Zn finger protein HypA/HybF involved in hydrogenase expression